MRGERPAEAGGKPATRSSDAPSGERRFSSYGSLSFRLWHGMCFGPWFRLLAQNRFAVSLDRLPLTLSITVVSLFNSLLAVLSRAIFDRAVSRTEIDDQPVFILGHWRSGTTLLHELLACDPQFGYPNYYQCFAPEHFLLTEKWLKPLARRLAPEKRPMDEMRVAVDNPQEDEVALATMGVPSPYLSFAFPNAGPVAADYLDLTSLSDEARQEWIDRWITFLKRVAYRGGKRLVLKSPTHTARLQTILKVFPNAKFVHLVRDPLTLYASTRRFYRSLNETQGLQRHDREVEWLNEHVLATFERVYARFEEDRKLIPEGNLIELAYEGLVADPIATVRSVYDHLRLGDFSQAEPKLQRRIAFDRGYRRNTFHVDDEHLAAVRDRWRSYIERYGYEQASIEPRSSQGTAAQQ